MFQKKAEEKKHLCEEDDKFYYKWKGKRLFFGLMRLSRLCFNKRKFWFKGVKCIDYSTRVSVGFFPFR